MKFHPRLIADARKARKASEQAQAKVKADNHRREK